MKVIIDSSPKFRRVDITIDGEDYTEKLTKRERQSIVWAIRKYLVKREKIPWDDPRWKKWKSVIVDPTADCFACPMDHHACAQFQKHLHEKIEVCELLFDLCLQRKLLAAKPIITKGTATFKFGANGKIRKVE